MRVLLLGDSHTVGSYGKALADLFAARGAEVVRVGRVGATASSYLGDGWKKLEGVGDFDAAKLGQYDLAVVTLGTNDAAALSSSFIAQNAAEALQRVAERLNAATIWYVGPPAFSANAAASYNPVFRQEDLNSRADRLWRAVSGLFGGRAVDSRPSTKAFVRESDIHLGDAGGKAWAAAVFQRVQSGGFPVWAVVGVTVLATAVAIWFLKRR